MKEKPRFIGALLCSGLLFLAFQCIAAEDPEPWLSGEMEIVTSKMFANFSPQDGVPGSVLASPSQNSPNYYFHWVRDAALAMDTVVTLYENIPSQTQRDTYKKTLFDYISFSRKNQTTTTIGGLGEPKFYVDGRPFNGQWFRPQNDGPALRAITAIHFAKVLLKEGREETVRKLLYDGAEPSQTLIKVDLEYVSHHWSDFSVDPWEEVLGDHFYAKMVQRRALIEGAELAHLMHDEGAARFYQSQAEALRLEIDRHWDSNKNYIVSTLNWQAGLKKEGLDSAVILGVLHGDAGDGFYSITQDRVLVTLRKLIDTFKSLYPINSRQGIPGTAVGRYPEDVYAGSDFSGGNPWVLITLGYAEAYYRAAQKLSETDRFQVTTAFEALLSECETQSKAQLKIGEWLERGDPRLDQVVAQLKDQGDAFMLRVKFHSNPDGSLSEQMDRFSGFMTSARDLTWSYAALLTATWARAKL